MAAFGEEIRALDPTTAWVTAAVVISALGVAPEPPKRPKEVTSECDSTAVGPIAVTSIEVAPETDPSSSAVAPAATLAKGRLPARLASSPPVPALDSDLAMSVAVAMIDTAPV